METVCYTATVKTESWLKTCIAQSLKDAAGLSSLVGIGDDRCETGALAQTPREEDDSGEREAHQSMHFMRFDSGSLHKKLKNALIFLCPPSVAASPRTTLCSRATTKTTCRRPRHYLLQRLGRLPHHRRHCPLLTTAVRCV